MRSRDHDMNGSITDVPSIKVGHVTDAIGLTGCTIILCEEGATAGVDVRGSAPGTRGTDAIRPISLVQKAHAILLTGGSAFGLAAVDGVMQFLEERGFGFSVRSIKVPIVAGAVIFDLALGDPKARPTHQMGYQACLKATNSQVAEGNVGAGTGATVGKILGIENSMKGGIGSSSLLIDDGIIVAAIVAVNAVGDVVDYKTGKIVAGAINPKTGKFLNTMEYLKRHKTNKTNKANTPKVGELLSNTTIGVVATNASLTKEEVTKVAQMAHNGLALAVRPAHTLYDGDTIFALSAGNKPADLNSVGTAATEAVAEAILRAVMAAESVAGIPAAKDRQ